MNFKVLALGAVLGFAVAVAPSCGGTKCSVANCKGCCSSNGKCVADPNNANNTSCGTQGNACVDCTKNTQVCNKSTYQCAVTGTGGGSGGGTDGGGGCGGCTTSSGLCLEQTSFTNCGKKGEACKMCNAGEYCTADGCTVPDSGIIAGSVGAPCTLDSDCTAVPMETGYQAFCKKVTIPGNVAYQGGYCTRRCLGSQACGNNGTVANLCMYSLGPASEVENVCLRGCDSTHTCRDGYACYNFGSSTSVRAACWVLQADGGQPEFADAGPGNSGGAGAACADNAQCGPMPYFGCTPETLPDGGPTGLPGGQCQGDCTLTLDDNWCGDAGICLPAAFNGGARGPLVFWQCGQNCDPTKTGQCRTGYVCQPFSSSGFGACAPDCRPNPALICPGATCDNTTGLCK